MKNIVLIGFMGTGKTSTGRVLAQKLGAAFLDLDQEIEAEEGMEITSVNLLQPQFKNDIDLPSDTLDQAAYAAKVFDAIHNVYRLAGEVIDVS